MLSRIREVECDHLSKVIIRVEKAKFSEIERKAKSTLKSLRGDVKI